ncbi:hypothetical protein ACIRD3_37665 [Kitasatospora sp. NPDC093550]|uniref:hypothetical protein n=1 Tax=Kitasatospora sp. NPDC093550 TaxID=3364089 RepID=UPI003804F0EC
MSSGRRPLWLPSSEQADVTTVPADGQARRLAVERAPVIERPVVERPAVPASRRRLGPGGLAAWAVPDDRD